MSAHISRPESELTLDASQAPPEPDEGPDDLLTVGARLLSGFTTVYEREDRSDDRVVTDDHCVRCGAPYSGTGVCEACRTEGDVLDGRPLPTIGGSGGGR